MNSLKSASLFNCNGPDLIPHAWAMQTPVTLVVLKPLVQTMFMKLMAAFSFDYLASDLWVCSLYTMRADSF